MVRASRSDCCWDTYPCARRGAAIVTEMSSSQYHHMMNHGEHQSSLQRLKEQLPHEARSRAVQNANLANFWQSDSTSTRCLK